MWMRTRFSRLHRLESSRVTNINFLNPTAVPGLKVINYIYIQKTGYSKFGCPAVHLRISGAKSGFQSVYIQPKIRLQPCISGVLALLYDFSGVGFKA